jgi:hypothetical protein
MGIFEIIAYVLVVCPMLVGLVAIGLSYRTRQYRQDGFWILLFTVFVSLVLFYIGKAIR